MANIASFAQAATNLISPHVGVAGHMPIPAGPITLQDLFVGATAITIWMWSRPQASRSGGLWVSLICSVTIAFACGASPFPGNEGTPSAEAQLIGIQPEEWKVRSNTQAVLNASANLQVCYQAKG